MLHDPSHYAPPAPAEPIRLSAAVQSILRELARQIAEIAADPVNGERRELWRRLNDLESARPMVWINGIPWHEMNVGDELTLQTHHPWARDWETTLRQTLYHWRHLPADMIVSDFIVCPLAIESTDFGIIEDLDVEKPDEANPIVSRHFNIQIRQPEDLDKIKMPRITHNRAATEFRFAAMSEVCQTIPGTTVEFEMVPIPGGTFKMGSPDGEEDRADVEGPQFTVGVAPFWMGKYELTWAEYRQYMALYGIFKEFDSRASARSRQPTRSMPLRRRPSCTTPVLRSSTVKIRSFRRSQ